MSRIQTRAIGPKKAIEHDATLNLQPSIWQQKCWTLSRSKFPPGDSPTPARASASLSRPPPLPPSKRSSPTPPRSTASPAPRPRWLCTCCGICPTAFKTSPTSSSLRRRYGVRSGSINPNLFQDQEYKFGSLCNPSAQIRRPGPRSHSRFNRDRQGARLARYFAVACRRLQLSRHAEHPQAHRLA